jgi:hypothetical protein
MVDPAYVLSDASCFCAGIRADPRRLAPTQDSRVPSCAADGETDERLHEEVDMQPC